jgi:hypothetical protein
VCDSLSAKRAGPAFVEMLLNAPVLVPSLCGGSTKSVPFGGASTSLSSIRRSLASVVKRRPVAEPPPPNMGLSTIIMVTPGWVRASACFFFFALLRSIANSAINSTSSAPPPAVAAMMGKPTAAAAPLAAACASVVLTAASVVDVRGGVVTLRDPVESTSCAFTVVFVGKTDGVLLVGRETASSVPADGAVDSPALLLTDVVLEDTSGESRDSVVAVAVCAVVVVAVVVGESVEVGARVEGVALLGVLVVVSIEFAVASDTDAEADGAVLGTAVGLRVVRLDVVLVAVEVDMLAVIVLLPSGLGKRRQSCL